jgi:hypothetical protein
MPKSAKAKVGLLRIEAWIVWVIAGLLALSIVWLVVDREPTKNEMTFAYRKHLAAEARRSKSADPGGFLSIRMHDFELIKSHCDKLAVRRYRCDATLLIKDHPADEVAQTKNDTYVHDDMGWTFIAPGFVEAR